MRSGVEEAPEWFVPPEPMLTGVRAQMAEQSGVLSRGQALAGGLTEGEIRARVASGRWQRVHPGVFAVHGGVLSRSARLWAALLYAGEGAALSHQTAAEVLGFRGRPDPLIHVTIPSARRVRKQPGLVIHRADRSVARVPLPVVSAAETVLDLTDVATCLDDVLGWVARGCAFRTSPDQVRRAMAGRLRLRWRRDLRVALGDVADGAASVLELRYVRDVERRHGLPRAVRQRATRRNGRQDVFYEKYGLTIELDGRAFHGDEQRGRDRRRDNASVARREATMRYDWADVHDRPCAVAAEVAEALIARGWPAASLCACAPGCAAAHLRQS